MDNKTSQIFSDIHRRSSVEQDLLKKILEILFPTEKSWLQYTQSLYSIFPTHIRDMMIVKGGTCIDYHLNDYKPTDFDFEINNQDVKCGMYQFLMKNNYDFLTNSSIRLINCNDYTETPIGNLSLVCDYIDEVFRSQFDEIIQSTKTFLYNLFETNEFTLSDMCIRLKYGNTPFNNDHITVRICKQLNIPITEQSSNIEESQQYLTLYLIDVCIRSSSNSHPQSVSTCFFPYMSLEYSLIDYFRETIGSCCNTSKFKRRAARLQKLIDLIFLKSSEVSENLLEELVDCGTNVINPYEPTESQPLIGRSDNVTSAAKEIDPYGRGSLIELLVIILKLNDSQLTHQYLSDQQIRPLDDLKKQLRSNMLFCFQLINQSPYFDELCQRYRNHKNAN
ncbi:hypothetical protein I4U23_016282 [Adineta vaga]|nr:hypothetical protein I4U23_016282 [Adineta vaga]